jgi:hypothetical protein
MDSLSVRSVVQGKGRNERDKSNSESNSFDHNDDMSEDEMIVLGGKDVDVVTVNESDGDVGGDGKRAKKRRRGVKMSVKVEGGNKSKSKVWEVFDKVNVPNKSDKENPLLKAKCKYSNKLYSYTQGSTTTLSRHMKKCLKYQKHVEEKLDQTLLNFAPSKAGESDYGLPTISPPREYNHEQVKKLISKIIIVHEYLFRMVGHTWFNIVMKYMNPLYEFIGRKNIRAECLKVYES